MSEADVCSRALALLIEAEQLLEQLVENGEVERGSPPFAAGGAAMTEQRALALAQARALQQPLQELAALYGPGSCPALAADLLDEAISYLRPSPPGPDEDAEADDAKDPVRRGPSGPPRLRIVGQP